MPERIRAEGRRGIINTLRRRVSKRQSGKEKRKFHRGQEVQILNSARFDDGYGTGAKD
jgi:hypothetical protein